MTLLMTRRMALAGALLVVPALAPVSLLGSAASAADRATRLQDAVDEAVRPVMEEYGIPGLAVAVTAGGKRRFFNYGVASNESGGEVTEETLFEIGSISKTFTATLAAYAQVLGAMSLSDKASKHLPELAGSSFDRISLLELGTYTAGGLPLQFPDEVTGEDEMIAYYRTWRPDFEPGTHRLYSNPSIGLFGHLAGRSMGAPFSDLMEERLFPALGLSRTYIRVPEDRMADYAYGYTKDGKRVRVNMGVLGAEAYGVRTTASDLIRFIELNMDSSKLDPALQQAIAATHIGYFGIDDMTQGLGWEMYAYPTKLDRLLAGNSREVSGKANKAKRFDPPWPARDDVLINKTGSTRGFGAYAAFVPVKNIGVVLLANKAYPIPARVKAAHAILKALDGE